MGYVSSSSTPDELGKMHKVEIGKWAAVIKDAGLKVE
jgi:tripartite-type tricarboxylate transporter receptor subunit TctC